MPSVVEKKSFGSVKVFWLNVARKALAEGLCLARRQEGDEAR